MSNIRRYKLPLFLGSAMAGASLPMWLEFRLEAMCGPCVQRAPLWALGVLAMAGIISTTQLVWYLYVEKRGRGN